MPKRPQKVTKSRRSSLKIEALEQRQLLAGVTGAGTEVGKDIQHPNGNIYDQVLMTGSSVTVTADPGQVTRVSFLDASGDIVQAEFAGAGSLTVSLAGATGPVTPDKYAQPSVQYMKGTASFTIQGSDATTNFGVFSVGTANANGGKDNPIFAGGLTGGNNVADVQRITIVADPSKPNGSTFGGIRAGNAVFGSTSGVVGISAAGVQVQDVVIIGDIDAAGTAIPTLIFGTNSQFGGVTVSGGDLVQTNGISISNTGSYNYQVALTAGGTSGGTALPAQTASSGINFTGSNPLTALNNTFTLTTSVDLIPGMIGSTGNSNTNGNDVVNGVLNDADATKATLTVLDNINTGTGTDTLNILDLSAAGSAQPTGVTVAGVETVNLRGVGPVTFDTSTWTGVTNLNITQATNGTITAAPTTAINAAGLSGNAVINGGSTVTVANTGATNGQSGTVSVGATTAATGAVTVTTTGQASTALTGDTFFGAITVNGGTTITVTETSPTSAAATDVQNYTVYEGAVTVNGNDSTTAVTVNQDYATVRQQVLAAGSKEVTTLTFTGLNKNQTTIIDGLIFTAAKDLTAAQVAQAFANVQISGGNGSADATLGYYTGKGSANWSSSAVNGATVTYTAAANGTADLAFTAGDVDPTGVTTDGAATVDANTTPAAQTGRMGAVGGQVLIDDQGTGTDSIATVTLSGFGAGSKVDSGVLTTLNLSNSNEDLAVVSPASALALSVSALGTSTNSAQLSIPNATSIALNGGSTTASVIELSAPAMTSLSIAGSKVVNLNGPTGYVPSFPALTSVTVADTATMTINPTAVTYTGGTGVDTLTFNTANPTKATSLGAGNDTLTLAAGTTASTAVLDGGDGTDILAASALDLSNTKLSSSATFEGQITGFEKISILRQGDATTAQTIDLANLDDINYVITAGQAGAVAAVAAVAGTKEVTKVDFAGTVADGDTFIFSGQGVVVKYVDATPTLAEFVTAIAGATYPGYTAATDGVSVVTFTAATAGNRTDLTSADFTGKNTTTETVMVMTQGVSDTAAVAAATQGGAITITNMANTGGTVEFTNGVAAGGTTTVNLVDPSGAADSLNLVITNNSGQNVRDVIVNKVESINLTVTDSKTDVISAHTIKIVDPELTTLTVTGNAGLTLTAEPTNDALTTSMVRRCRSRSLPRAAMQSRLPSLVVPATMH